ncbi:protein singed wings 2 isoform X2 [Papilio machaon]|uniref:protein singed wings 2 isoform X2 n=1 Tax=Papilio machaon TaxID=76193 RepID=UPI001E665AE9|nr:protein singed wings 2 isoform X2 [Papilio machaon]
MKLTMYEAVVIFVLFQLSTPIVMQRRRNEIISRDCSLYEFTKTANCVSNHNRLFCKGGFTSEWVNAAKYEITHLKVLEWPGPCLDVARLQHHFPALRALEIVNCSLLTKFKGRFVDSSKIEKIGLHGLNSLWEVPADLVSRMSELRELDLRGNELRHIRGAMITGPPLLQRVHLSNNKWDCSDSGLDWLAIEQDNSTVKTRIVDYYQLICNQRLYKGKPLHKVMDIIKMVRQTCPEPCACAMTHVVSDLEGAVIPMITVDCSNRHLEVPPATLPPGTTTLRLENNKINTIRMIIQNPQYKKLADLYLDNNSISAVKELEGSEWFGTFRVLSLRGNLLKQIPVYAFDKAIQVNNNIMHVMLGHNPWRCDCHFIPRFQALLLKYKRVIRDQHDIKCPKSDDKTISLVQISTISLGHVCSKGGQVEMPISYINIVNLILMALIMLILGRFIYDWHTFKTTGKLPWLSSILP